MNEAVLDDLCSRTFDTIESDAEWRAVYRAWCLSRRKRAESVPLVESLSLEASAFVVAVVLVAGGWPT